MKQSDKSITYKLAIFMAISLPAIISIIGTKEIIEGISSGLTIDAFAMPIFMVIASIVVTKRTLAKIKMNRDEAKPDNIGKKGAESYNRIQQSAIWDFSQNPVFPLSGILCTFAFFIVGSTVFLIPKEGYTQLTSQMEARSWPVVTGVVTHSEVVSNNQDMPGFDAYKADIHIAYLVNGKQYLLRETYAGQSSTWKDNMSAYKERNKFKKNQTVEIHYQPGNPEIASADTSLHTFTIAFSVIGLVCYLLGLLSVYYTLGQIRRYILWRRD